MSGVDWVGTSIPCVVTDPHGLIRKAKVEFVFDLKLCPYEVSVIIPDAEDPDIDVVVSLDRYLLDFGISAPAGSGWAHVRPMLRNTVIDWQCSPTHHWRIDVPTEELNRFVARTLELMSYLDVPADHEDRTLMTIPDDVVGLIKMMWPAS